MVSIHLDTTTFRSSQTGSVTGQISLHVGEEFFPERDWNDFPVVVLTWWIEAIVRVVLGRAEFAQCLFMDGPFTFDVIRISEREIEVRTGTRDGVPQRIERTAVADFARAVCETADAAIAACENQNWFSKDLDSLRKAADQLRGRFEAN